MKITMVGAGYVGLVSGVCFSDFGHNVVCFDKSSEKIAMLEHGEVLIYEPGLNAVLARNVEAGRLTFTTDLTAAVDGADAVFIAVGTPTRASSPYLLFLNPDACLLPGSLAAPLAYLQASDHTGVGIVGIQLVDKAGNVQRTCAHTPTPFRLIAKSLGLTALFGQWDVQMKTWDHAVTRPIDQVMGAFFMIRRDLFDRLGGFDERFFVYFEEVDLSRRAAQAGYGTIYLAEAQAYHKGGGVSEQVKAHRLFYSLRSRIQYAFKHFSRSAALLVSFATLVVEPLSRLALLIGARQFGEIGDLTHGYRLLWRWVFASAKGTA